MVVCQIDPGQTVYCEAGKFLWKTGNVSIETRLTTPETEEANKEKSGFEVRVRSEGGRQAGAGRRIDRLPVLHPGGGLRDRRVRGEPARGDPGDPARRHEGVVRG